MISDNLLSPTQAPDRASLVGRDAASLKVIQLWLTDPRFSKIQPQLQQARLRIQEFVLQENQGS